MCGLAGFVGTGSARIIRDMLDVLAHRGPDGEGTYADPILPVRLGHCRLAILDIAGGHQPMWNEDGTVGIIYNGEIYNHLELRRDLISRGHTFATDHSDTEVLVHGYEEWGRDLPVRLNGMFAFAVLDRQQRRLFLARDRFGEKPLYYVCQPGLFAFASELPALAQHPGFTIRLRHRAIQKFLAYGFLPAPHTLWEDAYKLPCGSHLTYEIETSKIRTARYWQFSLEPDESLAQQPEAILAEELRALLFQAVRRRLISDVPLGVFLSGGIDSSAVLAGAVTGRQCSVVRTFTIGFHESSFDESDYAELVARAFATDHAIERVDLAAARDNIPSLLTRIAEPIGDASILPTFLLSRFTRKSVTVALSGDGGDELFAGYDPFRALAPAKIYQRLVPRGLHRGLQRLADILPISSSNMSLDFKLRRALLGLSYSPCLWNPVWLSPVDPRFMREIFAEPLHAEELYEEAVDMWRASDERNFIDRTLEFYTNFYLPENILFKMDRAAMLNSLESRAVFLDNDLVDFCRRLPHQFKYYKGERKYLLKHALKGIVPVEVLGRPKKGFGIPLRSWLRTTPASPPMQPLPGVRIERVARAWRDHRFGAADHRLFLWSWLSLQWGLPQQHTATPLAA
jgi:asparagine synthase (glutamine-hydrolysing)